ncbi:UvrABC system B [Gossypium arboreum]|uniref:UvrABC system B n=1 Tax=Gossypium arboreum TaxID=29729 RepID=A0A0B0NG60_GOSAR|nr:UvrABC system B [Gossypium arboreum]
MRYVIYVYMVPGANLVHSTGGWVVRHVLRIPDSLCEQPE